jgi:DNA-binding transcriptional MerR regulator
MADPRQDEDPAREEPADFPLRVATRVTGLKPELLRAWETRHGAIHPRRTPGGSRRYSARDLDRLRLLRDVVAAGHRIGRVARLDDAALSQLLLESGGEGVDAVDRAIDAAERLEASEVRDVLRAELEARGVFDFATEFAIPLLVEVGRRWEQGGLSVSAEHLVSSLVRSTLTDLVARADPVVGHPDLVLATPPVGRPDLVLATPPGERHDLGTLVAAIVAVRAGARPSFVGADVPIADLATRVIESGASVLVLGLVTLDPERAAASLRELRALLPEGVGIWVGGPGLRGLDPIEGVERIGNLGQLEAHVLRLGLGPAPAAPDADPPAPARPRREGPNR